MKLGALEIKVGDFLSLQMSVCVERITEAFIFYQATRTVQSAYSPDAATKKPQQGKTG